MDDMMILYKEEEKRHVRLVVTEDHMTCESARKLKGNYKRVFVRSTLPRGPVATLQPTSHHAVNMRKITH